MRDMVLQHLRERFQSLNDIVETLDPALFNSHLEVSKNKTVGEHMWCIVGARESYANALSVGDWAGFTCSLSSTENWGDVQAALVSSEAAFESALSQVGEWTPERESLLMYLLEHETTHEAQLIRHLYGLEQTLPESVKWA
ncbi:hypothetical protein LRP50_11355 [Enterovibrio sp. ZSDZ42]|uniref:DinB family protein n=1 Tax=Enterovibrio gelatinilyticus TaxID=2899819 RepID=A0ABT5R0C7_9GAMM|nr:hypothetical protein [Enterovibrio sp. ZSDZ42]MDD1793727.1 hypothetical protein [Enterovibrio sp. ZSDZ42]